MRASVTDLESFRRYEADEDMELGVLLAQLRREEPPTLNMRAGIALHALLESAGEGTLDDEEQDGFRFSFECDAEIDLADIRELRVQKTYTVDGEPIVVTGRMDEIGGTRVGDHKFCASSFDAVSYADSYQWRLYLDMTGAQMFRYNVFVGTVGNENDEGPTDVRIREFHPLPLYRYPELASDVQSLVERYAHFAKTVLASA